MLVCVTVISVVLKKRGGLFIETQITLWLKHKITSVLPTDVSFECA